jgi:hypothetical protein
MGHLVSLCMYMLRKCEFRINGAKGIGMDKFMSLRFNGRAKIVLTLAFLVPPLPILSWILIWTELRELETILLLWSFLALLVVGMCYSLFGVAALLIWMKQGLSAMELYSWQLMGHWVIAGLLVLATLGGVMLFRYEIIPIAWNSQGAYYKYDRLTGEVTRERARRELEEYESKSSTLSE